MDALLKNKIIDSRNEELWNSLIDKYDISVNVVDSDGSRIIREDDKVSLELAPFQVDVSIFTHELLHLWLWKNECDFVNCMQIKLFNIDNKSVSDLFDNGFDYTFSNITDHICMFEKYKELGCDIDKFLPDKNAIADCWLDIVSFISTYNKMSIEHDRFFITCILSIYEAKYTGNDHIDLLTLLRIANNALFDIIEEFVNNIKDDSPYKLSYNSCVSFLANDLDDYYSSHPLTK